MSDPVSNADIEDVLSSIRRLVSVDDRTDRRVSGTDSAASKPRQDRQTSSVSERAAAGEPRLVLSPSFRVRREGDAAADDATEDTAPEADHLTLDQWQVPQEGDDADMNAAETAGDDQDDMAFEDAQDAWSFEEAGAEDDAQDYDAAEDDWDSQSREVEEACGDDAPERGSAASDFGDSPEDDAELREWLEAENARNGPPEDWQDAEGDAELVSDAVGEDAYGRDKAAFDEQSDEAFDFVDFSEDDDFDSEMSEPEPVTSELEARIAEVEAAVAARQDQWEPDGASQDPYAGGRTEPLPWEDHVEQTETSNPVRIVEDAEEAEETEAKVDGQADVAEIAEPDPDETVEVETAAEDEVNAMTDAPHGRPESEDDVTLAGVAAALAGSMPQDAEMEAAEAADLSAEAQELAAARFSGDAGPQSSERQDSWYREDADAVLDEDALRDLVSEIVRQELQGTLGERITRNVRKLVRREIHRAMMGQDLD